MKTDRLISIIMILLKCERISATRLADIFEVSPRTIYRDVESISFAGVPIITYPGSNGGIAIEEKYKIEKGFFSNADISTLLMGLGSVSTTMSDKEVVGTLAKVRQLIPENQLKDIDLKSNQISIDLTPWAGNKDLQKNLEHIKKGLDQSRILTFSYVGKGGHETKRQVEPYQLVLKEKSWYLQGYCIQKHDFRVFKVLRMTHLALEKTIFDPRPFKPKILSGADWIEKRLITIKLKCHVSIKELIIERCGDEHITPYGEDSFLVNFPFADDELGYRLLMSFGDKCECIEPTHIREKLKDRIKGMMNIYQLK